MHCYALSVKLKLCHFLLQSVCHFPLTPFPHSHIPQSGNCVTSLAAVGAPQGVSLERLILQGAVRVTWSPPTDLCGLTNPQYTIQYGRSTSTPTTHSSTPSSSPFDITGLEVGQEYFVSVAVHESGTFSGWESVTTCKGVRVIPLCYFE